MIEVQSSREGKINTYLTRGCQFLSAIGSNSICKSGKNESETEVLRKVLRLKLTIREGFESVG